MTPFMPGVRTVQPRAGTMVVVGCRTVPGGGPDRLLFGPGVGLPALGVGLGVAEIEDEAAGVPPVPGSDPHPDTIRISATSALVAAHDRRLSQRRRSRTRILYVPATRMIGPPSSSSQHKDAGTRADVPRQVTRAAPHLDLGPPARRPDVACAAESGVRSAVGGHLRARRVRDRLRE
ncbi:MAG TPA: hypothetical protein VII16_03110 [Actinomycetes bacterium]